MVKRIIEDQGGKIIFESTEGKGSTFGFYLPIKSQLPKKDVAPTPTEKAEEAKEPVAV